MSRVSPCPSSSCLSTPKVQRLASRRLLRDKTETRRTGYPYAGIGGLESIRRDEALWRGCDPLELNDAAGSASLAVVDTKELGKRCGLFVVQGVGTSRVASTGYKLSGFQAMGGSISYSVTSCEEHGQEVRAASSPRASSTFMREVEMHESERS